MIQIKTFYFNDLRTCCYVLWDESLSCIIVDPGCYTESEKNRLVKFIAENGLKPEKLINTHGHFDHVTGNVFVGEQWGVETWLNRNDIPQLLRASSYGSYFGYDIPQPSDAVNDLTDGMRLEFGRSSLEVRHTPGHSRGGVILYGEEDGFVLTGDSLFAGSIGRTDLPGGDYDELMDSLWKKILVLPPETQVLPGHGPATTIASELSTNPFLTETKPQIWQQ